MARMMSDRLWNVALSMTMMDRKRCRREQCISPCQEDIGIDVAIPESDGDQLESENCSDGIQPFLLMPIVLPSTASSGNIHVRGASTGKANFIEVYNGALLHARATVSSVWNRKTMNSVSLGMAQVFFF